MSSPFAFLCRDQVDTVAQTIAATAYTGEIGDGKTYEIKRQLRCMITSYKMHIFLIAMALSLFVCRQDLHSPSRRCKPLLEDCFTCFTFNLKCKRNSSARCSLRVTARFSLQIFH